MKQNNVANVCQLKRSMPKKPPRSSFTRIPSKSGNHAAAKAVIHIENMIMERSITGFLHSPNHGDAARSIIMAAPPAVNIIIAILYPSLLERYAAGISRRQLAIPCVDVVTIDNMSPAPSIVAKRMMIALSWIITEDTEPQQADLIASLFALERWPSVRFSAASII